jgi:UDP-GlcNAc:undecaprenyl-phosphate GlcNAc-1-phosphate transferase
MELGEALLALLVVSFGAFVIALALTPVVARVAVRWGVVDRPDGRRKLHASPVPTVGGVAVFTAFACVSVYLEHLARGAGKASALFLSAGGPLVVAGVIVMAVGLVDDTRGVRPATKLAFQLLAAGYLYYSGFRIEVLSNPFGAPLWLGLWSLPITLLWLIGMSNAINLIDGMDGLAAGLALVSTVGLMAAALFGGRTDAALVAAALAGALLGFLPYNFNPARVFLGDCGSLPVGLILAAVAVKSSMKASAAIAFAVPLLALALPILDVALAIVRRVVRRKPVFEGDHDHIHHRLVDLGLSPRRAVVTLYGVAVLFSVLALVIALGPWQAVLAALALVALVVGAGVRALGYWEVTEFQRSLLNRVVAGLRPSADAALKGLEADLARIGSFDEAWERICATAWEIGFHELQLNPRPAFAALCPEVLRVAPELAPGRSGAWRRLEPAATATWAIEVEHGGAIVADVIVVRRLQTVDFDPVRFATILRTVVSGHVGRRAAESVTAAAEKALAAVPSNLGAA